MLRTCSVEVVTPTELNHADCPDGTELIAPIRFGFAICSCLFTMKLSTMALSAHTPSYPPKAAEVSRSRSNQSNIVPAPRQGAGSASSPSSNLNKVLFTLPWSVQFGESLSVSGEGSELGSWNPEESLPLKWNEGDLWAAGTIRHYG